MKRKNAILFFLLILASSSFGKVIYVNSSVVGNNDGTSWTNAYTNFQNAINEAVYGDSIWVAQGIYYPTNTLNREISFTLNNGVKWFGGFQGNEGELNERDYELYVTTLSGDIGIVGDSTDNSYYVVYTIGSDSTTIIDGFTIQDGQALPSGNLGSLSARGGGMLAIGDALNPITIPIIRKCHFRRNVAFRGGGLALGISMTSYSVNPTIAHCKFSDNYADSFGGAVIKGGGSITDSIHAFYDCTFENNYAKGEGGAIYLDAVNEQHFESCIFKDNRTASNGGSRGGAIATSDVFTNALTPKAPVLINDCMFSNNGSITGSIIYYGGLDFYGQDTFKITISNSIFFNNEVFEGNSLITFSGYSNKNISIIGCEFLCNKALNSTAPREMISFELKPLSFTTYTAHQNLSIINSTFERNTGVLYLRLFEKSSTDIFMNTQINNCTFFNNANNIIKRELDFFSPNPNSYNRIHIANSIFWQDQLLEELFDDGNPDSTLQGFNIHHSLLKTPDCLINGVDACGDGMLFSLYPEFRDTLNGDLSLRSCSPLLNQGDNAVVDSLGIAFDIAGTPRIIDAAVDLGAYETQAFEVLFPQVDHVSCAEGMDGAMSWIQHGTPPYSYEWTKGTTTGTDLSNLNAGNYNITITDADSCISFLDLTINQPLPLEVQDSITDASSSMSDDGRIDLTIIGGIPNYEYLWSTGDTTSTIENLLPGVYTVTVTDANDCELEQTFEVDFMTGVVSFWKNQKVELQPNFSQQNIPVKLFFEISEASTFELRLSNELGQIFFTKKIKQNTGQSWLEIPSPSSSGLYFLEVKSEGGERKILKWVVL